MNGDDFDWSAWIERSPALSNITPEALAKALDGFPVEPKHGLAWLARAIQGALCLSFPFLPETSYITGDRVVIKLPNATEARHECGRLSRRADEFLVELRRNSDLLTHRILTPDSFSALVSEVEKAATALAQAASAEVKLSPRWRQKRAREDRISMAVNLSTVFQMAFGSNPTINSWPDSDGGPWPDFYQRIARLVLGEQHTPDLLGILKAARKHDWFGRVTFAEGQIPEYRP